MKHAFSLVELSIVLVILGLLTGGILTGQSLIRAAELRAVSTEFNTFQTATFTFRDKYFALPGDMRNATQFWGRLNTAADCVTNSSAAVGTPGACDGNGNGNLTNGGASQAGEAYGYWQQLANAGLIEGTYTGISGTGSTGNHHVIGTNAPRSKVSNAGWGINSTGAQSGSTILFDGNYGANYVIGTATNNGRPSDPAFTPEEAWNIDTKIDDGQPAQGAVVVADRVTCTATADGSTPLTNSGAHAALLDASYNLSNTTTLCAIIFRELF